MSTSQPKTKKHAKSISDTEQKEDGEISDDEGDSDDETAAAAATVVEDREKDVIMRPSHRNRSILTQRKLISYDFDDDDDDKDYYRDVDDNSDGTSRTSSESSGRNSPHAHTAYTGEKHKNKIHTVVVK